MYYVTMTDKFMSDWGLSKDLINKLIFVCEDYNEAMVVYNNAKNRDEMKYINILTKPPSYYRKTFGTDYKLNHYYVQIKTKDDYGSWYKPL